MNVFRVTIIFSAAIVLWIMQDVSVSNVVCCSCYSFHGNSRSREEGRKYCQNGSGDLVSMETVKEWEFIKANIKNNLTYKSEWWIGHERRDGNWTWSWLSDNYFLYQDILPKENNAFATIVANNTNVLFNVVKNDSKRIGWICEYSQEGSNHCYQSQVTLDCRNLTKAEAETTSKTTTSKTTTSKTTTSKTTTSKTATLKPTTSKPATSKTTTSKATTSKITTSKATTSKATATASSNASQTGTTTTTTTTKYQNTPKTAKLTSTAPKTGITTATTARGKGPYIIGFLTTTFPQHECLPYPYQIVAISVSVAGGVAVLGFTVLFLCTILKKKYTKPPKPIEKLELEVGEYENHL